MSRHVLIDQAKNKVVNVVEVDPANICTMPVVDCLKWHVPSDHTVLETNLGEIDDNYDPGTGAFSKPPVPPETVDYSRQDQATDYLLFSDTVGFIATAVPNAGIELPNSAHEISTHGKQAFRIGFIASLADPAIRLRLRYSLDSGATWLNGPSIPSTVADGLTAGDWGLLPQVARDLDVLVKAGIQGNGVLSPVIKKVYLQVM